MPFLLHWPLHKTSRFPGPGAWSIHLEQLLIRHPSGPPGESTKAKSFRTVKQTEFAEAEFGKCPERDEPRSPPSGLNASCIQPLGFQRAVSSKLVKIGVHVRRALVLDRVPQLRDSATQCHDLVHST